MDAQAPKMEKSDAERKSTGGPLQHDKMPAHDENEGVANTGRRLTKGSPLKDETKAMGGKRDTELGAPSIGGKQDRAHARDITLVKSSNARVVIKESEYPPADSVDKQLAGVDTLDQIDFKLRENIQGGCPVCCDL